MGLVCVQEWCGKGCGGRARLLSAWLRQGWPRAPASASGRQPCQRGRCQTAMGLFLDDPLGQSVHPSANPAAPFSLSHNLPSHRFSEHPGDTASLMLHDREPDCTGHCPSSQTPGPLSQERPGWGAVSWGTFACPKRLVGGCLFLAPEATHGTCAPSAATPGPCLAA